MMQIDRRRLLGAALAAAPAFAFGTSAARAASAPVAFPARASKRVFVESEFAPLRSVVLTQSEAGGLDVDGDRPARPRRRSLLDATGQKRWEAERDAFGKVLEKHGVEVLRPRLLTNAEKDAGRKAAGYTNFFVRDPWFTVGNFVIEGNLRYFHRRIEVLPCRDVFLEHVYPADCLYVAAPMPAITGETRAVGDGFRIALDQSPGPFIEGGDVLVWGKRVYVGHSGQASSALGIQWLRKLLGSQGYTVETVELKENTLHLDCAIGMVREGLLIHCGAVLPNGLPKSLQDWERIEMTEEEALQLGTNGFPINPKTYVMDPAFRRVGDQLTQRGILVEYIDFPISRGFGGAFRCSTQPLWRES